MSYRGSARARDAGPAYMGGQRRLIRWLLAQSGNELRVACAPDNVNVIYGWSLTGDRAVHYVYVRDGLRKQGIARALLRHMPEVGVRYTAKTHHPVPVPKGWAYDPMNVFFPVDSTGDGKASTAMGEAGRGMGR